MESPNQTRPSLTSRLRNHRLASTFTLLTVLTGGVIAGSLLTRDVGAKEQQHNDTSDARPLVIPNPVTLSNGFSAIVKQVGPAVVNINTESLPKKMQNRGMRRRGQGNGDQGSGGQGNGSQEAPNPGDMQDFFNKFFGGQGGGGGDDDDSGPAGGERQALGSGFIVDPRGYIITNNHVVDKADKIYVKLAGDPDDGSPLQGRPATVVGVDPETDIAVIKIDTTTPLPTIKLGNSDGAQVGDWVLAIGSPFGLSQTVSAGIISSKNRSLPDDRDAQGMAKQFQKFLQTDAAINPGNSGGPLVDMAGQVVGMNTAIYTSGMGSQGVGFALPSNILARVYNDLISPTHKVVRGSIGVQFQANTNSAVGRMYGFPNGGVIIGEVTPNRGAARAGLQAGDVLVTVGGRQIKDGDDLVADISARPVGSSVEIGYLRDGKLHTANVQVGDRTQVYDDVTKTAAAPTAPEQSDAGQAKLGITVQTLDKPTAKKIGVAGGVVVTNVTPGSFADDIGLAKGSLVVEINRQPVTDQSSYNGIVSKLKAGDDVVFVVHDQDRGGNGFVGGTLR
jgi:serine protease Do